MLDTFATRISRRNRGLKWSRFLDVVRPTEKTRVLDVGYTPVRNAPPHVNYLLNHFPWPANVTALGVGDPDGLRQQHPGITFVQYDGDAFPFDDDQFNVAWSNAVIEHVGSRPRQRKFLAELIRVSKTCLFTTPNRGFPVEVHTRLPFVHYLPKATCDRLLEALGRGWATGDYMHLFRKTDLVNLLRESGLRDFTIIHNRFLGLTMDFLVVVRK